LKVVEVVSKLKGEELKVVEVVSELKGGTPRQCFCTHRGERVPLIRYVVGARVTRAVGAAAATIDVER